MNIFYLPDDLIYSIYSKLPFTHLRMLNTTIRDFYLENIVKNKLTINSNKIKLYYKLKYHQLILFEQLNKTLNDSYFDMIENNNLNGLNLNGHCLIYSPINQYGLCRFCNKNLSKHKYDKLLKIYLNLGH
jgi:hypothetical protein